VASFAASTLPPSLNAQGGAGGLQDERKTSQSPVLALQLACVVAIP
jgi:hypothetical protein